MSDQVRERFEIPKEMRSMAEASVEQARRTFEKFLANAQATAGSLEERGATMRAGAKDISLQAIANVERNTEASLDYADKLVHAKDLPEVMRLHSEYVQTQMRSLAEQASEIGQMVGRTAMQAAKPKNERLNRQRARQPAVAGHCRCWKGRRRQWLCPVCGIAPKFGCN